MGVGSSLDLRTYTGVHRISSRRPPLAGRMDVHPTPQPWTRRLRQVYSSELLA